MRSFRQIVDLWPSPTAMALDVGAPVESVRKWRQRDRIPAQYWEAVARSPPAESAAVTSSLMARLLAARPRRRRSAQM
jgi:hypothetical protein